MHNQKTIMEQDKRSKVRFNDNVAVHEILHVADFTEKEIIDTWYTNEETVHTLERTLRMSNNECSRGLENVRSSKRRNHRQKRIKKAVLNVLNEQEQQKMFEYNDTEKIALVNVKDNGLATSKALELGLMDYEYVKENVMSECRYNEQKTLANTKEMSECLDYENTLEINNCFQYEVELESNTKDLTTWSVSLSISVVQ